ncbi:hypothetical protein Sulfitobl28_09670 [Sulfitobacter pontiacus]|nr:hypothetical protein Sulfitobl28_09670 [Sulfitobacter pontiacus]
MAKTRKLNEIHDVGTKSAPETKIDVEPSSSRFIGNEAETIMALKHIFTAFIDLGFETNSAADNVRDCDTVLKENPPHEKGIN